MDKRQKIIYIYFILLPFIDLVTSLLTRFTDLLVSPGMILKGLIIFLGVFYVLFFSKSKYRHESIKYFILLFFFGIIYIGTKSDIWQLSFLINEIVYAFRYFYFPVMLIICVNVFDDFKFGKELIKKILIINCLTYVFLLLIPYISGTGFNSYRYNSVEGTNGWFYAANETGVIMIILLSSIFTLMDNNNKWKIIFALPILISIAIIGTKVSYFGMIITVFLLAFTFTLTNKKQKFCLPVILILFLAISLLFSPAVSNLRSSMDWVNNNDDFKLEQEEEREKNAGLYKYNDMYELIGNKQIANVFTVALNGRADFFLKNYSIYSDSGLKNQLFGISWSNRKSINYILRKKLIEIDYLDIIIHYGIVGFIVYFLPLIVFYRNVFKKRKLINGENFFYIVLSIFILVISSFSGHVLAAPAVSIYLVLLLLIIESNLSEFKLKENEITILALHLGHGGIEQYLSSLCKMLEDKYKINIIATYKVASKPAYYFSDKINIRYLIDDAPNRNEFHKAINDRNIMSIIRESINSIKILILKRYRNISAIRKIDSKYIITTRDFHNKLVGRYAFNSIIKIATEHNYHNNDQKYIKRLVKSLKDIDYFVCVSQELKEFYESKLRGTNCIYIPNVIDNLPNKTTSLNKNILINVGRLEKEKGQSDLIDVVAIVKKKINNIKLYLIGDGSLRSKLEEKVKSLNLEENVIFTGFISKDDMEKYLVDSKLFVLTSYTESFGLVLLEAMSYKVPCIAFDSANGAKHLLDNGVGVLIKDRNKDEMANNIIRLLNDKEKLNKISEKGYNKCKEYLIENVKNEWIELLKK